MTDPFAPSPKRLSVEILNESDRSGDGAELRLRVEDQTDAEPVEVPARVSGSAWSIYPREEIVQAIAYRLNAEPEDYRLSLVRALAEMGRIEVASGPERETGPYIKLHFELTA